MKRSEMVYLVEEIVNDLFPDIGITDEGANQLLKRLEEAGMNPPGKIEHEGYGSGDDYFYITTTVYGWEPENA